MTNREKEELIKRIRECDNELVTASCMLIVGGYETLYDDEVKKLKWIALMHIMLFQAVQIENFDNLTEAVKCVKTLCRIDAEQREAAENE